MDKFKFDAMVSEFPFLTQLLPAPDYYCQEIQIKRVDEILDYMPRANYAAGALVGIQDVETVSFVTTTDGVIENAVQQETDVVDHAYAYRQHTCGETILEAIDRLGVAETLTHIVVVNSGYYAENHYSTKDYTVEIYKASRDETIANAVVRAKTRALATVRAEADF